MNPRFGGGYPFLHEVEKCVQRLIDFQISKLPPNTNKEDVAFAKCDNSSQFRQQKII